MKRSLVGPAIAFVVVLGAVIALQILQRGPSTGYAAVDFTLPDLSGTPVTLSDLRGKIVFLNLWATWCAPCRAEMPSMQALYERFKGRDFTMIAVSEDTNAEDVAAFAKELKLTFPILLDTSNRLPGRFGVTGYPETFIIDRDGRVIEHFVGPENWMSPRAIAYFEKLLGGSTL